MFILCFPTFLSILAFSASCRVSSFLNLSCLWILSLQWNITLFSFWSFFSSFRNLFYFCDFSHTSLNIFTPLHFTIILNGILSCHGSLSVRLCCLRWSIHHRPARTVMSKLLVHCPLLIDLPGLVVLVLALSVSLFFDRSGTHHTFDIRWRVEQFFSK